MQPLILLPHDEYIHRIDSVKKAMKAASIGALLIADNADTYYLTGRIFIGWIYIPAEGIPAFFARRPVGLQGDGVVYIRKPEEIRSAIKPLGAPATIGMELDLIPYASVERLKKQFPEATLVNASPLMRAVRSVKSDFEIRLLRQSGEKQSRIYRHIPHLFTPGMTDIELQIEIERELRSNGCLGQFRIAGDSMELFMGSVLVGDNADNPTPYDFAMGGAGLDSSIPAGANGTAINSGNTIMIDMNGNFTGYMTDMTRTFAFGEIDATAIKAHRCSIDICHELSRIARPGVEARTLYDLAEKIASDAGLNDFFMGHRQKAGFIGHGVGIEINELPVISPRSRDILAIGNVIALEPKFVIPHVGAVGIENTYVVGSDGLDPLVDYPESLQYFSY